MTNFAANKPQDVIALAQKLIERPSITPHDEGAMDVVQSTLEGMGFSATRLRFGDIENLYARRGNVGPNLCFAGHTDVVPDGARDAWDADPFGAIIKDGFLYGRGAVDMKGAIAAWMAAVSEVPDLPISLSFLITGDEEGEAINGTTKVVDWLKDQNERLDHCIVGEPTAVGVLGDMIKVGRRGSINATITVTGKQGHVAYPHRALNPAPILVDILAALKARVLDDGYARFQPSNLEITTIDIGNKATNVIPLAAMGRVNIRFNPNHKGAELRDWIVETAQSIAAAAGAKVEVKASISGESFLTEQPEFIALLVDTIKAELGVDTDPSTTGGTSDARFIKDLCPVVEFGLVGTTMHMVNECVAVADLVALKDAYKALISAYAAKFGSGS